MACGGVVCVSMWEREGGGREGGGGEKTFSKKRIRNLEDSFLNEKRDLVNRDFEDPKCLKRETYTKK